VPAYVVFGDATLLEMAARRPTNDEQLLEITGVGRHKLARYGPAFLAAIAGEEPGSDATEPADGEPRDGDSGRSGAARFL
jgi:hypothetical protein